MVLMKLNNTKLSFYNASINGFNTLAQQKQWLVTLRPKIMPISIIHNVKERFHSITLLGIYEKQMFMKFKVENM